MVRVETVTEVVRLPRLEVVEKWSVVLRTRIEVSNLKKLSCVRNNIVVPRMGFQVSA